MAPKSKAAKGADTWDDDDVYEQPLAEEFGAEASSLDTPDSKDTSNALEGSESGNPGEETEATLEDFLSLIRSSKQKKKAKELEEKDKKDGPKLLSKKEKERLKKEAERAAKKEQAVKKKAEQAAKKEQIKEANKRNTAAASSGATNTATDDKKSSKESAATFPESLAGSLKTTPVSSAAPAKKGNKVPAALAALKKQMELKKQMDEEQKRLDEEEENRRIEEEKAAEEELKRQAEAKEAKKEKERRKIQQLKAEGTYLTKKQKEQKRMQERQREILLQLGNVTIAAFSKEKNGCDTTPGGDGSEKKPKRIVYEKMKRTKPKTFTQKTPVAAPVPPKEESRAVAEDDIVADDWEQLAAADGDDDMVADDWESALKDEEDANVRDIEVEAEAHSEEEREDSEAQVAAEKALKEAAERAQKEAEKAKKEAEKAQKEAAGSLAIKKKSAGNDQEMRSPICCILGHVDTGKTKLLDKIRQTNVQGGEAGGITQQIGATYFPMDAIRQKTAVMATYEKQTFAVPGLLIIDTPGHESFTNLRSRGSSLCNIAILVIDIMHGLEQQTLESIRLLRDRKAPFIVALNKIDRLYDWESMPINSFRDSFLHQGKAVQGEFFSRLEQIKLALAEQGLNSELYFQNKNISKYVSIVPTSAVTGEGIPDLLWLLLELTQKRMSKQLMYLSQVEATILEVKVVEGFGYTIDVVLSNGVLKEGDRVVLCGLNGPICTNIRALLTPPPSRELRIKSEYIHLKEVKAALGVKIAANDLEKAVAGTRLLVVGPDDDEEELMEEVMDDLTGLLDSVDASGKGVVVQASTLGSLEALLDFLKALKIPVMSIGLGPVYKRDVMKATTMLEKAPEYAVMLCFDVKIDREAEQYAEEQKVKIFNADIIYHLFDAFTAFQDKLLEQRRKDFMEYAVMPCILKTVQIINKRNPMIIGVDVVEGAVRVGTPICAVRKDPTTNQPNILVLGKVVSLEVNHKSSDIVKKGQTAAGVAMRLENPSAAQPTWGRHVDESDNLYSLISRKSIDTLKDPAFRDTVPRDDWVLLKKLKPVFDIK